ncbi:serine acetyltransferase [Synechococcus sp. WH 8109]|nr:serine acetyltransferase [Synechococcus sp. WH 8109]
MQRIDELENGMANLNRQLEPTNKGQEATRNLNGESQNLRDREILELLGDVEEKERGQG